MVANVGNFRGGGPGHTLRNGEAVALGKGLLAVARIQNDHASRSDGLRLNARNIVKSLRLSARRIWNAVSVRAARETHGARLNVLLVVITIGAVTAAEYSAAGSEKIVSESKARIIESEPSLCTAQRDGRIDRVPLKTGQRSTTARDAVVVSAGYEYCRALAALVNPRTQVIDAQAVINR